MCKDVFLIMILDKSTHELIFMSKVTIWDPLFLWVYCKVLLTTLYFEYTVKYCWLTMLRIDVSQSDQIWYFVLNLKFEKSWPPNTSLLSNKQHI